MSQQPKPGAGTLMPRAKITRKKTNVCGIDTVSENSKAQKLTFDIDGVFGVLVTRIGGVLMKIGTKSETLAVDRSFFAKKMLIWSSHG